MDDTATAFLMQRFYANLLGRRPGLDGPLSRAEALREAKWWLRGLHRSEATALIADLSGGVDQGPHETLRRPATRPAEDLGDRTSESPHYWAAFVLTGDPD